MYYIGSKNLQGQEGEIWRNSRKKEARPIVVWSHERESDCSKYLQILCLNEVIYRGGGG